MQSLKPVFWTTVLLLVTVAAPCQTMTVNVNWLPAAAGTEPVRVSLSSLPSAHYQLLAEDAIGVRWNRHILPAHATSESTLEFTVPPELRTPGITEFVLWDTTRDQPLPYRAWISVVIPSAADVFEADSISDRVVAAVGADGTGAGTGGQISVFRLSTGALLQTVDVPQSQRVLVFTPDTAYAWIAVDESQGRVARLNLATGELDQQIQFPDGAPPYHLKAQVYPQDSRILVVLATWSLFSGARAYLNGVPLPNPAPAPPVWPLAIEGRGRLLLSRGTSCDLSAAVGFRDCAAVLPGFVGTFTAVWNNRGFTGSAVIDLTTGATLLDLNNSGTSSANYLPQSNRVLLYFYGSMLILDGDSLEMWADTSSKIPSAGPPRRVWSPDYILMPTVSTVPSNGAYVRGILVGHLPQLLPAPSILPDGIVNAASFLPGPIAPGEIVSIFGQSLGPAPGFGPVLDGRTRLSTEVEHTRVLFDGVPGTVLYAGPTQINVVVPETVQADSATVQVVYYGIPSARIQAQVSPYRPGIFGYEAGNKAYAVALNPEGVLQGPSAPLRRGAITTFWATGLGLPDGDSADTIASRAKQVPAPPTMTIGGRPVQLLYVGVSPGSTVGLTQLNAVIPPDAPTGDAVQMVITTGNRLQGNAWVAVQ